MTRARTRGAFLAVILLLGQWGCGDDGPERPCEVGSAEGCPEGRVCAAVQGAEEPACFAPVVLSGRVTDAASGGPVEAAAVILVDANGAPRTGVARTDAEGRYEVTVTATRREDGQPMAFSLAARVTAADYVSFPTPPRIALPVDLAAAVAETNRFLLEGGPLDVVLMPLPQEEQGGVTVAGKVLADEPGAVLVVASQAGQPVSTAYTDSEGRFLLFNVPVGPTEFMGIKRFLLVAPATAEVGAAGLEEVGLVGEECSCATVSGSVNLVDAPGGLTTSVILAPVALFDEELRRGEAPVGFRASAVSSGFAIDGVPPGDYAVLAAFENDGLVLDPDLSIAGTTIQQVTVPEGEGTVEVGGTFKVTGALDVVSPGADSVSEVTALPVTLEWADDSSEDGYVLRVYDAFGELVLETEVPLVTGAATVTYQWQPDLPLTEGLFYQFRAWSYRDGKQGRTYISSTEDLRGVFRYVP